jgi:hypothetical protein
MFILIFVSIDFCMVDGSSSKGNPAGFQDGGRRPSLRAVAAGTPDQQEAQTAVEQLS